MTAEELTAFRQFVNTYSRNNGSFAGAMEAYLRQNSVSNEPVEASPQDSPERPGIAGEVDTMVIANESLESFVYHPEPGGTILYNGTTGTLTWTNSTVTSSEGTSEGIIDEMQAVIEHDQYNETELDEEVIDQERDNYETDSNYSDDLNQEQRDLLDQTVEESIVIPVNSTSILVEEATSRFSSAIWYENIQTKQVLLAGLGGIGSYVAFLLARMNINFMTLYDPDVVEEANMSGQLYGRGDVGNSKVNSIAQMIGEYANYHSIYGIQDSFTENSSTEYIMICGFDNMEARKAFYFAWKNRVNLYTHEKARCLLIDGRLAAEEFQVFAIRGDDRFNMERYEREFLFSDEEAEETICSYKQTSFMANMIGSVMVNLFVNFVANECDPLIDRDLPFFTEYNAQNMFFNTVR